MDTRPLPHQVLTHADIGSSQQKQPSHCDLPALGSVRRVTRLSETMRRAEVFAGGGGVWNEIKTTAYHTPDSRLFLLSSPFFLQQNV